MEKTIVVSVNSTVERDMIVRNIYDQLVNDSHPDYTIRQDRVNRIRVLYKDHIVRCYLVIIIPIIFSLSSLEDLSGTVEFHLDTTISTLTKHLRKLQSLQGTKIIKQTIDASAFEQLVMSLS